MSNPLNLYMNRLLPILMFFFCAAWARAELIDTFYKVGTDGKVVFTDSLYHSYTEEYEGIFPYTSVSTIRYRSQGNSYAVEFLNFRGWDDESGFACVFYLYCNGKKILEFIDELGWCRIPNFRHYTSVATDDCLIFRQKNNVDVIVSEGYPYESQPRTIIVAVQGDKAKVVYFTLERKFHIESVRKDPDGYFEIKLEDSWPELGNYICTTPGCYTMKATAEGMFLYKEAPDVYAVRKMLVDFFHSYQAEWAKKNCDERKLLALREDYCTRDLLSKIAQEGDMIKALSVGAVCDDDECYRFIEAEKDGNEEGLYQVFYRKYDDQPEVCISVTVIKGNGAYKIASVSCRLS